MSLKKLISQYQSALLDLIIEHAPEARRWANARVDFYSERVAAERRKRSLLLR